MLAYSLRVICYLDAYRSSYIMVHFKRCAFYGLLSVVAGLVVQQSHAQINTTLWGIYSNHTMFSPKPIENAYLELEYMGQSGPVDWYGYVDIPKYFGGNDNIHGLWDQGDKSYVFMEHEPKISLNRLTQKDLSVGVFKDWYIATDWILEGGNSELTRQNTLYYGLGTAIDTHTKLAMNINVYAKQQFENYGAANAYSQDGGRLQVQFFYPLYTFKHGGALNYFTFSNYDFGSKLSEKTDQEKEGYLNTRTNESFVSTHILSYQYKHFKAYGAGRYFHNGGQFKHNAKNNWGTEFEQDSNGWGYYVGMGYQF